MSVWIISNDKKCTTVRLVIFTKKNGTPGTYSKTAGFPRLDLCDRNLRSVVKENEALTMRSVGVHKIRDLEKTFCLRKSDINISKLVEFQSISVNLPINAKWFVCFLMFTRLNINIYQYMLILLRLI